MVEQGTAAGDTGIVTESVTATCVTAEAAVAASSTLCTLNLPMDPEDTATRDIVTSQLSG